MGRTEPNCCVSSDWPDGCDYPDLPGVLQTLGRKIQLPKGYGRCDKICKIYMVNTLLRIGS